MTAHDSGAAGHPLTLELLESFARETGLTPGRPPRRYLWTDAFAVCGFLGVHQRTGASRWLDMALRLVDQVHRTLGRHRPDDPREGWISGLDEAEGTERPTAGGLRIGKPEPERPPGETYHPEREWDRDGQYYHYLTRWMHALNRVWSVTGEPRFHRWAVELARAANRGFIADDRMHWKMSIDLGRPLVPSAGQHDPLDGRVVVESLRATAPPGEDRDALLAAEASALDALCEDASWVTHDGLGVGGLLVDLHRMRQLRELRRPLRPDLEDAVLHDATRGLRLFALAHRADAPAAHRLAFRELGLVIGMEAAAAIEEVRRHRPMADGILQLWSRPSSRQVPSWTEHADINAAMLAVALEPDGYLAL